MFNNYFDLLEKTLDEFDLKDKPSQIYNCDESGMPLEHKPPRVVAVKGTKKVRQVSSGNKTQITILGCCSATGQAIPPMVVFSGKKFNHELSKGEIPMVCLIRDGWTKSYLLIGLQIISYNMLLVAAHYYSCSMVILPITLWISFKVPQIMMLSFFAYHLTRRLIPSPWIQVVLGLLKPIGQKHAVTSCLKIQVKWYQSFNFQNYFLGPGQKE